MHAVTPLPLRPRFARGLSLLLLLLAATPAPARQVSLTVLHTSCLHGRLLPAEKEGGGLLRLASAVESARAEAAHSLLVDTGDFFLGSAESAATGGAAAARAFAFLRYDFQVPGVRELALGADAYAVWRKGAPTRVLAANLRAPFTEPWALVPVDGIVVAVVGLTLSDGARHLRPELVPGLAFEPAAETLGRLLPALREKKPDVRILLLQAGGAARGDTEARRLLQAFPDFDVVIGGRDGGTVGEYRSGGAGPLYAEAGAGGEHLGRVDLIFDTVRRQVTSAKGILIPVGNRQPAHGDLRQALQAELDRAQARLDAPAAPGPLPTSDQAWLWLADHPVRDAAATRRQRFGEFPLDEAVGTFTCTAHELEQALAEAPAGALGRIWFRGLACEGQGERTRLLAPDGAPLNPRKSLSVSANARLLASAGGAFAGLRRLADRSGLRFPGDTLHARLGLTPPAGAKP